MGNLLHSGRPTEALQAFESKVSICLNQLSLNLKPELEFLCFSWIQESFELLLVINEAFSKLVVDMDYPMSKWDATSAKEHLKYSFWMMEFLNSISSSISHLGNAQLPLSLTLRYVGSSPLLAIAQLKAMQKIKKSNEGFRRPENKEGGKERSLSSKGKAIHQALMDLKSIGFWMCSVMLAGLSGDAKPYLEMRESRWFSNPALTSLDSRVYKVIKKNGALLNELRELNNSIAHLTATLEITAEELQGRMMCGVKLDGLLGDVKPFLKMKELGQFSNPTLTSLDSKVYEVIKENKALLKEMKELNNSTTHLVAALETATKELQGRMVVFQKLDSLGEEVVHFFSELLAWRNALLHVINQKKYDLSLLYK